MELLKYIIIGIVQGLTEFLPISSSGHLVLIQSIFTKVGSFSIEGVENHFLNVMVHLGTMIAIIIVFHKRILNLLKEFISIPANVKKDGWKVTLKRPDLLFIIAIIIGTIPTVIIGLLLRNWVKNIEGGLFIVAFMFVITGTILVLSKFFEEMNNKRSLVQNNVSPIKAFIIGIVQGLAVIPGISRSGITITTGVASGINREEAASFSFILSLPAIFGASLLEIIKVDLANINIIGVMTAFIISLIVGYLALKFLIKFIRQGKFYYFAIYVFIIAIISFILAIT
ncbi:MAG: undecaprenyl-diphosphate phosphatase [bacterium]